MCRKLVCACPQLTHGKDLSFQPLRVQVKTSYSVPCTLNVHVSPSSFLLVCFAKKKKLLWLLLWLQSIQIFNDKSWQKIIVSVTCAQCVSQSSDWSWTRGWPRKVQSWNINDFKSLNLFWILASPSSSWSSDGHFCSEFYSLFISKYFLLSRPLATGFWKPDEDSCGAGMAPVTFHLSPDTCHSCEPESGKENLALRQDSSWSEDLWDKCR